MAALVANRPAGQEFAASTAVCQAESVAGARVGCASFSRHEELGMIRERGKCLPHTVSRQITRERVDDTPARAQ